MENKNFKSNQQKPILKDNKDLDFWNFEEIIDPSKKAERKSPFPEDRIISSKEMNYIHNKLKNRIEKFKDSTCFNYLNGYYDFYLKTFNSKNNEEMQNNFKLSLRCLKLFTYCWESEQKEKQNL